MADNEMQKRALIKDRHILLSAWECFSFFFMRSISSINENVQPFFNDSSFAAY
jgi:hypothetical protein